MKKHTVKEKYKRHTKNNNQTAHRLRIFNETTPRMPRTALQAVYNDFLSKKYSLNVIGISNAYARKLNKTYRKKNTPANILTFPPDDTNIAEIYINTALATKTAKEQQISIKKQILFLYIHGVLHLLGHKHGAQMESLEDRYTTMYA